MSNSLSLVVIVKSIPKIFNLTTRESATGFPYDTVDFLLLVSVLFLTTICDSYFPPVDVAMRMKCTDTHEWDPIDILHVVIIITITNYNDSFPPPK